MKNQIVMWIEIYAMIVLLITLAEDLRQYMRKKRVPKSFLILQFAVIFTFLADIIRFILLHYNRVHEHLPMITLQIADLFVYVSYYTVLYSYARYVRDIIEQRVRVKPIYLRTANIICLIYSIMWAITPFNGMFISYRKGAMITGSLYVLGEIGGYLVILITTLMIIRYRKSLAAHDIMMLLSFPVLPTVASLVRFFVDIPSLIQLVNGLALVILHVSIFREREAIVRDQEVELARSRIQLLRSQIGPHFLFNTLNAIYVLCERDPIRAQEAVSDFSEYLRTNIDALGNEAKIPFEREMEHVTHYLRLEKMRFRDELTIETDLAATDFVLPTLTIQPIVENAINHGIGRKKEGGTVTIRSLETEDDFVVTVRDDGVGFDAEAYLRREKDKEMGTGEHIGLMNVRERLSFMSNGTLSIESQTGKGTIVTIRLPKKENISFRENRGNAGVREENTQ